jgi:hypothetical protein
MGNQMMYLQSGFTNSKPIVKMTKLGPSLTGLRVTQVTGSISYTLVRGHRVITHNVGDQCSTF